MKNFFAFGFLLACGSSARTPSDLPASPEKNIAEGSVATASAIKQVFVIALENQDSTTIYGSSNAPYLNSLMAKYAYATAYGDDYQKPDLPSEPHYIEMEAGTNAFSDHTFTTDDDPSAKNSTASTSHTTTALSAAGMSWLSYQESLPAACPVKSSFPYAAKHDPFVFFRDVSFTANKPDAKNAHCAAHHKDFAKSFAADLAAHATANYNFITPDLCDDMHGDLRCSNGCTLAETGFGPCIVAGDDWLSAKLPPLIDFVIANDGVIFIVWDEAEDTAYEPFIVISSHLAQSGANGVAYSHASLVKSLEEIFGLAISPQVAAANDFSSFFATGYFP